MLAYHNNPQLKQQILQQLQGSGRNISIEEYETRFGIPMVLAHLEDAIFEGLPNDLAKAWPIRFMSAIQVGADLSTIWRDFVIWLLVDPVDGVIQYTQPGTEVYQAIIRVAQLYQDGYTQKQMLDAAYDAYAVYSASYAASYAAAGFYAASAVYAASNIAAYSAYAAYSAAYAVSAAAYDVSAAYAISATYAVSAAANAHAHASNAAFAAAKAAIAAVLFIKISNKLIELLEKQEVNHDHK